MDNITRQNVTDEEGNLAGWFALKKAQCFDEATYWNGKNHISVPTGTQWEHEELYRTRKGRWVLHTWSQWQGSSDGWEFLTEDEATTWLILNEHPDAVPAKILAEMEV